MPFPVHLLQQGHTNHDIIPKSYTIWGGKGMPFPYDR